MIVTGPTRAMARVGNNAKSPSGKLWRTLGGGRRDKLLLHDADFGQTNASGYDAHGAAHVEDAGQLHSVMRHRIIQPLSPIEAQKGRFLFSAFGGASLLKTLILLARLPPGGAGSRPRISASAAHGSKPDTLRPPVPRPRAGARHPVRCPPSMA